MNAETPQGVVRRAGQRQWVLVGIADEERGASYRKRPAQSRRPARTPRLEGAPAGLGGARLRGNASIPENHITASGSDGARMW